MFNPILRETPPPFFFFEDDSPQVRSHHTLHSSAGDSLASLSSTLEASKSQSLTQRASVVGSLPTRDFSMDNLLDGLLPPGTPGFAAPLEMS